jgi:hypothetical protein
MPARVTAGRDTRRRRRPKGYDESWSPTQPVKLRLEQVRSVFEEYAGYLPLTVRQVFYRLVGSFGYEKTENAYDRLADTLVRARRARIIPFEWIRDDGVVVYSERWHHGIEDFWNDTGNRIRRYQRDRQVAQRVRLELWCESAGMAPQLARVADDYSVPVYSAGGFGSLTAVRHVADRALNRNVPTVLLHVGDHDPSGVSIFNAFVEDAAAFVASDQRIGTQRIVPVRVALTAEQVDEYSLPTAPAKSSDSRSRDWRGGTCQLEALAPDILAGIVREAMESQLDLGTVAKQVYLEEQDRIELWRGLPPGRDRTDDDEGEEES